MKQCTKCNSIKSTIQFYKDATKSDGLDSWCKHCRKDFEKTVNYPPKTLGTKICKCCGENKSITEFYKTKRNCDGRGTTCKECKREKKMEYRLREDVKVHTAEYNKDYKLRIAYGIGTEDKLSMIDSQNGNCAICGKKLIDLNNNICVDHDHGTGKIRGILCGNCNRAIGLFFDNPKTLIAAAMYLERTTVLHEN